MAWHTRCYPLGSRHAAVGREGVPRGPSVDQTGIGRLYCADRGQAEQILARQRYALDALAVRLLEDETVEGEALERIFQGDRQADGSVRPLPTYRHRPSPSLVPLPKLAAGLASRVVQRRVRR